jgi:hypothetical protein
MSTPSGDDPVAPFDQTNGMMPGADGESDGSAGSETSSAADRDDPDAVDTADGAGALGTGIAMRHGPAGT